MNGKLNGLDFTTRKKNNRKLLLKVLKKQCNVFAKRIELKTTDENKQQHKTKRFSKKIIIIINVF